MSDSLAGLPSWSPAPASLSREEAEALIAAHGGRAAGSVSKKTAVVLAGEKAGSTLDKAMALGIPVLTEEEFLDRIKG